MSDEMCHELRLEGFDKLLATSRDYTYVENSSQYHGYVLDWEGRVWEFSYCSFLGRSKSLNLELTAKVQPFTSCRDLDKGRRSDLTQCMTVEEAVACQRDAQQQADEAAVAYQARQDTLIQAFVRDYQSGLTARTAYYISPDAFHSEFWKARYLQVLETQRRS
jgi:hypothetical protein